MGAEEELAQGAVLQGQGSQDLPCEEGSLCPLTFTHSYLPGAQGHTLLPPKDLARSFPHGMGQCPREMRPGGQSQQPIRPQLGGWSGPRPDVLGTRMIPCPGSPRALDFRQGTHP